MIIGYIHRDSFIHRLDIRSKFVIFLFLIPITAFISSHIILIANLLILFTLLLLSRIGARLLWLIIRMFVYISSIFLILITILSQNESLISQLKESAVLIIRINTLIISGVFYTMITNPSEIPQALSAIKIPHRYGMLLIIGFRLFPYIQYKSIQIKNAIAIRGVDNQRSLLTPMYYINKYKLFIIPFLLSTLNIGYQLGETMIARGYNPYKSITISPKIEFKFLDWIFIIFFILLLILAISI